MRIWAGRSSAWLAKGKLSKLLELWVKGLAVDWKKLYGESKPRRVSLPTYPFAKERYWLPQGGGAAAGRSGAAAPAGAPQHLGPERAAVQHPADAARSTGWRTTWCRGRRCCPGWRSWRWRARR